MTLLSSILLFFAALAAGVLNSVAGGGTFLTFPTLIFSGVPAIPANATSAVAMWPGSMAGAGAYRNRLPRSGRVLLPLILASLAGGFSGAHLLLHIQQRTFMRLIPFLFLGATLLFVFGQKLVRTRRTDGEPGRLSWPLMAVATLVQFSISVYGGFFGGGASILMLAFLSFLPVGDIHAMNGLKTLLVSAYNAVAVFTFIVARIVYWPQAVLMLFGAVLGGYGGAYFAQKVSPARVRTFVICVGFALSFYFLYRYH